MSNPLMEKMLARLRFHTPGAGFFLLLAMMFLILSVLLRRSVRPWCSHTVWPPDPPDPLWAACRLPPHRSDRAVTQTAPSAQPQSDTSVTQLALALGDLLPASRPDHTLAGGVVKDHHLQPIRCQGLHHTPAVHGLNSHNLVHGTPSFSRLTGALLLYVVFRTHVLTNLLIFKCFSVSI